VSAARELLAWVKANSDASLAQLPSALKPDARADLTLLTERMREVERNTPALAASLGRLKATLASLSMLL
jgi:hypothetical protein